MTLEMDLRQSVRFHLIVLAATFALAYCSSSSSNHFAVGIKSMDSRWNFTLILGDIDRLFFSKEYGTVTFTSEQIPEKNGGVRWQTCHWLYIDVIENDDQLHMLTGNITLSYNKILEGSLNFSTNAGQIEYSQRCHRECNISISKEFCPKLNHTYFLKALYPQSKPLICPGSSYYVDNSKWQNYTFGKELDCSELRSKSDFFITECDPESSTPLCDADNSTQNTTVGIPEYSSLSSSSTFQQDTTITTLSTGKVTTGKITTEEEASTSTSADTTTTTQEQTELVVNPSAGKAQEVEMKSHKIKGALIAVITSLCLLIGAIIAVAIYKAKNRRITIPLVMN